MADLDDFFAKKDKKKSKKPKFLTAEELVKNLEETSKREVVKPKKPETAATTISQTPAADGETEDKIVEQPPPEDEWKEVEEEARKDYSGLKIGQLTMNDEDDDDGSDGQDEDAVDSEGNFINELGRGEGGPWKKVVPAEEVTQIPMEMPPKPAPSSKVYVSPALRAAQAGGLGLGVKPKVRSKAAPDITNADFFPTLGAARPEEQRKKKNEPAFEEVRHGGRLQRVKETSTAAPSGATNRFQSLDETES